MNNSQQSRMLQQRREWIEDCIAELEAEYDAPAEEAPNLEEWRKAPTEEMVQEFLEWQKDPSRPIPQCFEDVMRFLVAHEREIETMPPELQGFAKEMFALRNKRASLVM